MKAAVFSGDYVDLKFIKTRSVAQIHIEIPLEQAAAFIASYGAPNPAEGVPVGIARLVAPAANVAPAQIESKDRRKWSDMQPSQQAAMRCNEPGFIKFLQAEHGPCADSVGAAEQVRLHCGVKSRSELNTNQDAASLWKKMDDDYFYWSRGIGQ